MLYIIQSVRPEPRTGLNLSSPSGGSVRTSVLHSPVRTAVQTVWTGSGQSRPLVFLDCMKTVRPVRGFSGRGWTAVDRGRLPRHEHFSTYSKTAISTRSTGTIDPPVPTKPRRWQDHAASNPKLRDSRQLMCVSQRLGISSLRQADTCTV